MPSGKHVLLKKCLYINITGITAVGHDSESTISIPKCPDAGCYSRPIFYTNATIRQLRALTEISSECYQSIQVYSKSSSVPYYYMRRRLSIYISIYLYITSPLILRTSILYTQSIISRHRRELFPFLMPLRPAPASLIISRNKDVIFFFFWFNGAVWLYSQVNCVGAPFTLYVINFAWWDDINGVERNFWSGADETAHTCQCGLDGNCIRADLKCNCDANVAVSLSDIGDDELQFSIESIFPQHSPANV